MEIPQELSFIYTMGVGELLILLGLGIALMLFGYRIKKAAFFIAWFVLGYLLMQYFLPVLNQAVPEIATNDIYQTLLPFGGGAILALLGFSIEKFCVAGICFALCILVAVTNFGSTPEVIAIGAVVGLLFGAFAVMMLKPATIIVTALLGAYATTLALTTLLPDILTSNWHYLIFIILAVLANVFQFSTTRHS